MYNINFCKHTRTRHAQDFRTAQQYAKVVLQKKADDENARVAARVKSVTQDTITLEALLP